MIAAKYWSIGLVVLTLSAGFGFSAQAQGVADTAASAGQWDNEAFERQDFREEMQQIRREHEEIEFARDQLRAQCTNPSDLQAASCDKQKEALHERHQKLHERMCALRKKMDNAHSQDQASAVRKYRGHDASATE